MRSMLIADIPSFIGCSRLLPCHTYGAQELFQVRLSLVIRSAQKSLRALCVAQSDGEVVEGGSSLRGKDALA